MEFPSRIWQGGLGDNRSISDTGLMNCRRWPRLS